MPRAARGARLGLVRDSASGGGAAAARGGCPCTSCVRLRTALGARCSWGAAVGLSRGRPGRTDCVAPGQNRAAFMATPAFQGPNPHEVGVALKLPTAARPSPDKGAPRRPSGQPRERRSSSERQLLLANGAAAALSRLPEFFSCPPLGTALAGQRATDGAPARVKESRPWARSSAKASSMRTPNLS